MREIINGAITKLYQYLQEKGIQCLILFFILFQYEASLRAEVEFGLDDRIARMLSWSWWEAENRKAEMPKANLEVSFLENEKMAAAIQCLGRCRNFFGRSSYPIVPYTFIREKDVVKTGKQSFLWLYLANGALMRMAPESSVSFYEINLGKENILYHFRVNKGGVQILTKQKLNEEKNPLNLTDSLFLKQIQYRKRPIVDLNKSLELLNHHFTQRPTEYFAVMPTGMVYGKNLNLNVMAIESKVLVKVNDSYDDLFRFRSWINNEDMELEVGKWYQSNSKEAELINIQESPEEHRKLLKNLYYRDFLIRRIPHIQAWQVDRFEEVTKNLYNLSGPLNKWDSKLKYYIWDDTSATKAFYSFRYRMLKKWLDKSEQFANFEKNRYRDKVKSLGGNIMDNVSYDNVQIPMHAYYLELNQKSSLTLEDIINEKKSKYSRAKKRSTSTEQ